MDKDQLIELLHHYTGSSAEEAQEVAALRDEYPYCQVFQVLAARTSRDHNWNNQQSFLQMAAVACTDRSMLKEIMAALALPAQFKKSIKTTSSSVQEQLMQPDTQADEDVADKVVHDLEKLKKLKHNFEALFSGEVTQPNPSTPTIRSVAKPPREKSKKERIIELAKSLEKSQVSTSSPGKQKHLHSKTDADPLIDEIKSTKKIINPESEKTKEQIEIIDQFIKTKPSITALKSLPTNEGSEQADLSSSIKSGEFGDKIISETLVEILLKQGKKDKAIEVLKKLIWKFPQKKAYFAAQIEDLKK